MVRYDLSFFLCCCKSFLGPTNGDDADNFYTLLGVDADATPDEVKRAYKRRSLEMHPDKLAQRGKEVTAEDQARFTRMKEAYEVLSDPHKRETYDALGEKGMKWLEEPFSVNPQQLAHNFAASSIIDRSKIFAIFVGLAVAIFILPVLVCLMVDGHLGPNAQWMAVLTPLWIWDAFILFYHSRVIMMGPIQRPEHIAEEEWIDPLPMSKRFFSLFRFLLVVVFEFFAALKLDDDVPWTWGEVFTPIYLWEGTTLYKKLPLARMRIVTVEDLEEALGKPFPEFTQAEKELIARRYSVVPSPNSPEFEAAHKLKARARQDCLKLVFRIIFLIFFIINLDYGLNWNWWAVFTPIWILSFCFCCGMVQGFRDVVAAAGERDPEYFGGKGQGAAEGASSGAGVDEENPDSKAGNYGAMGQDGEGQATTSTSGTAVAADVKSKLGEEKNKPPSISEEEREELKAQVLQSGQRMLTGVCSQAFLLIITCLLVGKLEGAGYSSVVIISPFLFIAGLILCCLGCTIFCITEIPEEGAAGYGQMPGMSAPAAGGESTRQQNSGGAEGGTSNTIYIPPPPVVVNGGGTVAPQPGEAGEKFDPEEATQSVHVEGRQVAQPQAAIPPVGSGGVGAAAPAVPIDLLDDGPLPSVEQPVPSSHDTSLQVSASGTAEERQQQYADASMHSSLHELD